MYHCFQLKLGRIPAYNRESFSCEFVLRQKAKEKIREIITDKVINGDIIDATSLQNGWFPEIETDVFISHSRLDVDEANNLSAWLHQTFGLTSFIDSDVWGHADNLLKQIDDRYCFDEFRSVYNYNLRNFSTAHVHAMLSNALIQMIDRTECLFFLHTPNLFK